eukprot:TRINITY_DN26614_c0_g1_i1.p1 TRINITY_DN26614_c0_g1~~TRINITY_DN26614_c0_g1_i1.p1  ORF type:complete len:479 (-),score=51.76 TRINITY_DN26614_c0_g1_i1:28-1338(-)
MASREHEKVSWRMQPSIATWLVSHVAPKNRQTLQLPSSLIEECRAKPHVAFPWDRMTTASSFSSSGYVSEASLNADTFDTLNGSIVSEPPCANLYSPMLASEDSSESKVREVTFDAIVRHISFDASETDRVVDAPNDMSRPPALDVRDGASDYGMSSARSTSENGESMSRSISVRSSMKSTWDWFKPDETIIFFDWDDTLFPTTWIKQQGHCISRTSSDTSVSPTSSSLRAHESAVIALLKIAAELGKPVIVTLGQADWIERSISQYMPKLHGVLKSLGIDIIFAREALRRRTLNGVVLEGLDPWQRLKREAMKKALTQFYSRRRHQSWKNCVSIGDSCIERDALRDLAFTRTQFSAHGREKPVRCKTVKLVDCPTIESLTMEIELLASCLPALVHHDGDFSYEFQGDADESSLLMDLAVQTPHADIMSGGSFSLD